MLKRKNQDQHEFLPAALEVVETPANPLGRLITYVICALVTGGLLWAYLGKVDVYATATGRILPSERVKLVQPSQMGRVAAILVSEGDVVEEGQILIQLENSEATADVARISQEWEETTVTAMRLEAMMAFLESHPPENSENFPNQTDINTVTLTPNASTIPQNTLTLHEQLLRSEIAAFYAQLRGMQGQMAEKQAELAATNGEIAKWQEMTPLLAERVEAYDFLETADLSPRQLSMDMRQELVEAEHNIPIQQAQLLRIESSIAAMMEDRSRIIAEFERETLTQLTEAKSRADSLSQELIKAQTRLNDMALRAPVAGTLQQLTATTIGGVVQPAQQLAIIVPSNAELQVEAEILNRDIGFIEVGQLAAIKVEAFPFTRYGLIEGEIIRIDRAAVTLANAPSQPDPNDPNASRDTRQTPSQAYLARLTMDRNSVQVEGRNVPLIPGMTVTVEIKTDERRILDYLLTPLIRASRESLRER